ncbi:MAG: CDP-alcohol phosphatidyltransferase family protein, partial [Candidatus Nanohalobium sp.]
MSEKKVRGFLTLPNFFSYIRVPLAFLLVYWFDSPLKYLLLFFFILSDKLDGYIARKMDKESDIGEVIDPAMDKASALIIFFLIFPRLEIPVFYAVMFFTRDIAVLLGIGTGFLTGLSDREVLK